ncbi:MAG: S8 family serine peptidase [Candidatus Scalindua sp.]|nr:S8 family serine peptidase [Candidatus Scalindua sp.]
MKRVSCVLLLFTMLTPSLSAQTNTSNLDSRSEKVVHPIKLKSRTITPDPSVDATSQSDLSSIDTSTSSNGRVHILLQLDKIPNEEERKDLEEQGIKLLSYVPEFAWVASVPVSSLSDISSVDRVSWLGGLQLQDKVSTDILEGKFGDWHYNVERDEVAVIVHIHKDIALIDGRNVVAQFGGEVRNEVRSIHALTAHVPSSALQTLAQDDRVSYVETAIPALGENNDGQQAADNIDVLQPSPYNTSPTYSLDGSGVGVLVYDGGQVDDHIDFGSRLTHGDAALVKSHATHVAGTIAGDGTNSAVEGGSALQWHGVAPAANIISYGYERNGGTLFYTDIGDIESDWDEAKNIYDADLGTASLGSNVAANGYTCSLHGDYGAASALLDAIVRGSLGGPYIATWAAGNERASWGGDCATWGDGSCGSSYGTIAPPGSAKNPIHVGASNSNDNSIAAFSSWGPTDDGRIKPTITAAGSQTDDDIGVTSTDIGDTYSVKCGTSMATPAVAGIVALMLEQYREEYATSGEFLPSTAKAILMNSASDAGNVGPDYQFGYGLVDAQAAVDTIIDGHFRESTLHSNGEEHEYAVRVLGGTGELQVSLAWDDPAATAYSVTALVNDLDLELISPMGVIHQAWILDPANPVLAATTGTDTLNNQEQVTVNNPEIGVWRVRVRGTVVPTTPQQYSLAATHQLVSMDILEPTSSASQNIGPYDDPGKLLIRLAIKDNHGGPFTIPINPALDLAITIGSEPVNNIILASTVGNEYWLIVNAPTQLAQGCYDLSVSLFDLISDSESNSVCYTEANEEDMILTMDVSGSMGLDSKLDAAKDASQFFITMTDIDDKIGVVSFSWQDPSADNTLVDYPLTAITGNNIKNAASLAVEGLTAGGWTPLGSGMQSANNEMIDKGDPAHEHTIVLLSDGISNRGIDWADDVEDYVPTDTVIHTLGFGPEGDPNEPLLSGMANDHNGMYWRVYTGASASSNSSVASATTNVLADAYRRVAEETLGWQRFWEVSGRGGKPRVFIPKYRIEPLVKPVLTTALSQAEAASLSWSIGIIQPTRPIGPIWPVKPKPTIIRTHSVSVEAGLGVVIFAAHWNQKPSSQGIMSLHRPDGTEVRSTDADVISYRVYGTSSGHEQYVIANPAPGSWKVGVHSLSDPDAEYFVVAETRSDAELILLSPKSLDDGFCTPVPVRVAFVDHQPIMGATVVAQIVKGDGSRMELVLYDDGVHEDGDANDGLYGNTYLPCSSRLIIGKGVTDGSYTSQVKVEAEGVTGFGSLVERSVTESFVRKPLFANIIKEVKNPRLVNPQFLDQKITDRIRLIDKFKFNPQILKPKVMDPDFFQIKKLNPRITEPII